MAFEPPGDLTYNRGRIADPAAFAHDHGVDAWLFLCGEEFAGMEGGMSYEQVEAAVAHPANLVADPPRELTPELAERGIEALDALPRPAAVTCRMGPRSSALVYLYAGRKQGASGDEVIARAEQDGAPFVQSDDCKAWVREALAQ